jgi:hypothetical protein
MHQYFFPILCLASVGLQLPGVPHTARRGKVDIPDSPPRNRRRMRAYSVRPIERESRHRSNSPAHDTRLQRQFRSRSPTNNRQWTRSVTTYWYPSRGKADHYWRK